MHSTNGIALVLQQQRQTANSWTSVTYGKTSTDSTNIPRETGLFVAVSSNVNQTR